jgi:acetyl-CoA C-acetyltransferase
LHGLATAVMLIRTGIAEVVVVEGHSKASNLLTLPEVVYYAQDPILNRPLKLNTEFVAGMDMNRYLYDTDTTLEQCAAVVVKNRAAALGNPRAAYGAKLTADNVLDGPMLAWPLGRRQVAVPADGAVVLVLASESRARALASTPVWILGVGWCNGASALESREWGEADFVTKAARMAYRQAGIRQPAGVFDLVEVDDTYAYKELQHLEALGLCAPGMAGEMTEEGATRPDGDLPVNVSGGSLGMGHLLDASGLARAYETVLQLRGTAGGAQLDKADVALVQSWRGVPTTSAAVAVLAS